MNNLPRVAMSELQQVDQVQDDSAALFAQAGLSKPVSKENVANDDAVKAFCRDELFGLMWQARLRRRSLEDEWIAIRKMDLLVHDEGRRYLGRSNAYVPIFSKGLSTNVSVLSKGLFPSDDYMDVYDRGAGDTEAARALKAFMQYQFETVAQLRRYMKPFLRQFSSIGNGCLKFWWEKDIKKVGRSKSTGMKDLIRGMQDEPNPRLGGAYGEGLRVSARSMFNVYVLPETAESVADAVCIFEDIEMPRMTLKEMVRLGRYLNVPEPDTLQEDQDFQLYNRSVLLDDAGRIADNARRFNYNKVSGTVLLCEVWTYMPLPASLYLDGETVGSPLPVRVVMAGDTPISVLRVQDGHQCFPYLFGRQQVQAGFFYGSGPGRSVRSLQYLTNDFTNQANDVGNYSLNPIAKVIPSMVVGVLPPLRPGVRYNLTDPSGVTWDRPPVELIQAGQGLTAQFTNMTQDMMGAPPSLQGASGGGAAKTATGQQILQRNALGPLQDIVEDLENELLVPLMYATWRLAMQYMDKSIMLRVMDEPMDFDPSKLDIQATFRWMASSQATNQQQRAQQVSQFLQTLLPWVPELQQMQYQVDPTPLIERFYNDGLGFRGFGRIITKMQPQPMQPGIPGQAGPPGPGGPGMSGPPDMRGAAPQAPQAPPGGDPRSALAQVYGSMGGGNVDVAPQPGEAEEFMNVRNQADEMAALRGKFG